jgi:hypothetical protein
MRLAVTSEHRVAVPVVFIGADEVPVYHANQFAVQNQGNEFFVTIGSLVPPILLGNEAEQREQVKQIPYVPIKVVARISMTRDHLAELVNALQETLTKHDQMNERPASHAD